jgi:hypothetical protein
MNAAVKEEEDMNDACVPGTFGGDNIMLPGLKN